LPPGSTLQMHKSLLGLSTTALVVLAGALVSAASATPTPVPVDGTAGTTLPLSGFSHIVADPTHGHEFISGGIGVNGVEGPDATGALVETIPGLPGASGMALAANGRKLYVALGNGDGIARIDTGTLHKRVFATGADSCPGSLALAAGLVWFGYGCRSGPS